MKTRYLLVLIIPAFFALAGCATPRNAPVIPTSALFYRHYKAPLDVNYQGEGFGTKTGTSTARYLFVPWPLPIDIAWDDAAIKKAADDGNITTVKGADYEFLQVIGLYAEVTVHAYGD